MTVEQDLVAEPPELLKRAESGVDGVVLGLLLVRREERRRLVSSAGPCNEIVRRA